MPSSISPVVLILGGGPNIGQHVARRFAAQGYKVAITSRTAKADGGDKSTPDQVHYHHLQSDLSDPDSVVEVFGKVKALLGPPSVVVYNAAAATQNDPKNPFSLSLADFTRDLTINTTSAFVAAQQAVSSFEELPDTSSRTFIYTGNILNTNITIAPLLSLGVGKSATAHMIHSAATVYADQGFKFYYADERKPDGSPPYSGIDGEAHGDLYWKLSEEKSQGPWQQTFVKGVGYKDFSTI